MNLGEARVGEERAFFVRAPRRRGVAALRVRRQKVNVAVAARAHDDRVRRVRLDFSVDHVARDDAARMSAFDDELQHFGAGIHFHVAQADLPRQRGVGAEQKLLTSLPTRVERA